MTQPQPQQWAIPEKETFIRQHLDHVLAEVKHLDVALPHVSMFATAVDAGANTGFWTGAMSRHFQRVIAFEPAPDAYQCLRRNTVSAPHVELWRAGLSDVFGISHIGDDLSRPGNLGARYLQEKGEACMVMPLDALQINDLGLLKVDVEGYELWVLKGARDTIKRCRPVVILEVKPFPNRYDEVDHLSAVNYLKELDPAYQQVAELNRNWVFAVERKGLTDIQDPFMIPITG